MFFLGRALNQLAIVGPVTVETAGARREGCKLTTMGRRSRDPASEILKQHVHGCRRASRRRDIGQDRG